MFAASQENVYTHTCVTGVLVPTQHLCVLVNPAQFVCQWKEARDERSRTACTCRVLSYVARSVATVSLASSLHRLTVIFINPRRACTARVTVVVSCVCVCLSVCLSAHAILQFARLKV